MILSRKNDALLTVTVYGRRIFSASFYPGTGETTNTPTSSPARTTSAFLKTDAWRVGTLAADMRGHAASLTQANLERSRLHHRERDLELWTAAIFFKLLKTVFDSFFTQK